MSGPGQREHYIKIQGLCVHEAEGGSRLGHVKSDAKRGLHYAAHRTVVALPKRRKPEGRSRSGARGELPHAATREFAKSYRINLRLLPELAFSSEHDVLVINMQMSSHSTLSETLDVCNTGTGFLTDMSLMRIFSLRKRR